MVILEKFPNYDIYEDGRVYSHFSNKFLKPSIDKDGYEIIKLSGKDGQKRFKVHRLVAKAFIPNPQNKPLVNHIDGNKSNNCVENLEWCTHSENDLHAFKIGLRKFNEILRPHISELGKKRAKAVQYVNLYSGYTDIFNSVSEACNILGLNYDCVRSMVSRNKPYLKIHAFQYI